MGSCCAQIDCHSFKKVFNSIAFQMLSGQLWQPQGNGISLSTGIRRERLCSHPPAWGPNPEVSDTEGEPAQPPPMSDTVPALKLNVLPSSMPQMPPAAAELRNGESSPLRERWNARQTVLGIERGGRAIEI